MDWVDVIRIKSITQSTFRLPERFNMLQHSSAARRAVAFAACGLEGRYLHRLPFQNQLKSGFIRPDQATTNRVGVAYTTVAMRALNYRNQSIKTKLKNTINIILQKCIFGELCVTLLLRIEARNVQRPVRPVCPVCPACPYLVKGGKNLLR
jgi:hypothetical protein